MSHLTVHRVSEDMEYTGEQLRSHWAYTTYDIIGDSAIAFVGPCDVRPEYMKDWEDLKTESAICSERMLHFIVEHFDVNLERAVLRQHLLIALMAEQLNRRLGDARVIRRGSDLYDGDAKVTVSVASRSAVSALIHAGINVSSRNTPVPTRGLDDYDIDVVSFADDVLAAYARECAILRQARCKVRACT